MYEIWVKCPSCGTICRVFMIQLSATSLLLVNPHKHDVMRGVGGRSAVLLTEMRMVRNPYIGRIYGPQLPGPIIKNIFGIEKMDGRVNLHIKGLFFVVEGRSKCSEDIIRALEKHGENLLEWLPKIAWMKCLLGAKWDLLLEAYAQLVCRPSASLIPPEEAEQKSDYDDGDD